MIYVYNKIKDSNKIIYLSMDILMFWSVLGASHLDVCNFKSHITFLMINN